MVAYSGNARARRAPRHLTPEDAEMGVREAAMEERIPAPLTPLLVAGFA
jgi:hypothetical protein